MTGFSILAFIIFILLIWLVIISWLYYRQQKFIQALTEGISKKDLKTILTNIASSIKTVGQEITSINHDIEHIQNMSIHHFQKIGFVRFNPYDDTGGEQSFCLCILNQENSGFIITSLHNRDQTRIYAKTIAKSETQGIQFSKEEIEAYQQAKGSLAQKN